ncbi:hypothetical protein J4714_14630 [Staphylococcus epidermidis]|nr:hypothetical protein [Staphylococcus epidermidis]
MAQGQPAKIQFRRACHGQPAPLFALMLGEAAKVPVEVVGYKGSGPLLTDLMGGQVPIAVDTFDTQVTQHEAEASCACWRLRATSAAPWRRPFPRSRSWV